MRCKLVRLALAMMGALAIQIAAISVAGVAGATSKAPTAVPHQVPPADTATPGAASGQGGIHPAFETYATCGTGFFCDWNTPTGIGFLCFGTNYRQNYPTACANANQSVMNLDPYTAYLDYLALTLGGSYIVLPPGHYLDTMKLNSFNECWTTTYCYGYGQSSYHNVDSVGGLRA